MKGRIGIVGACTLALVTLSRTAAAGDAPTGADPAPKSPETAPQPAPGAAQAPPAAPASASASAPSAEPASTVVAPAPTPSAPSPSSVVPASPSSPVVAPAPAPTAEAPATQAPWYQRFSLEAFVDTYFSHNWRSPRPNSSANTYHPFDPHSGFGLAWLGLDAGMDPDPVGATLQLRFGPSVPNLALNDWSLPGGIGFIQNGYVSLRPGGSTGPVTIVAGKFDTVFGAEVAQSQLNMNYTRGFLYNLAQPFFHTGVRVDVQATEKLAFKVLAVNGWNNTLDNNRGKTFGGQVSYTPIDEATVSVGYLGGPEESDVSTLSCATGQVFDAATSSCGTVANAPADAPTSGKVENTGAESRWRHMADVVVDVKPNKQLRFVANGTYVTQTVSVASVDKSASWVGAALYARYAFTPEWAGALRGEILNDPDGQITAPNTKAVSLYTGTMTLEYAPVSKLLVRLDNRIDAASEAVFAAKLDGTAKSQFTTTLGLVVKTN
jgi:hypothetical protein